MTPQEPHQAPRNVPHDAHVQSTPAVSVVMGVFNCQDHVEEAASSVLQQTFRDFEFIIIDDGSSDGSLGLLRKLEHADPRIRLISRPNKGLAATGNELIGTARGHYIAMMDHDDVMLPDCLAAEVEHLDRHPGCVAVSGNIDFVDARQRLLFQSRSPAASLKLDYRRFPPSFPQLAHSGAMFRADAIRSIGGYRNVLPIAVDCDMWLRLCRVGSLDHLDQLILRYRWHQANTTGKRFWENQRTAIIWRLSTIARETLLDDTSVIERYAKDSDFDLAIGSYGKLLGAHFPVETYVMLCTFVDSISPLCPERPSLAKLGTDIATHLLSWPPTAAKLTLAKSVLVRAGGFAIGKFGRPSRGG